MSNIQGKVSREIRGHIFLIGLDRANKRNAFDSHMIQDLSLALTEYENNPELRCAVIFAHGDHFTAGLDLVELQPKLAEGIFSFSDETVNPWGTVGRQRTKPLVTAVQGYCYTAGIELMLNSDIVVANENTQFTQIEVQRGILPFGGATVRFIQAAGWAKAMKYVLTGDLFYAQTAYEMNLVTEVVEGNNQLIRAIELAERIAQVAPLAVQAALKSAHQAFLQSPEAAFANLQGLLNPLLSSEDAQEGVNAMLERRAPQFKGK
ncbi:crotonase/enoyl-CoA hydratase family protein [Acinetobacter defluvii]|uniref:Crotonase/enoyl-CoA hydratase family protein n=1 Tax=Acinetobacter defluvii TaxID=1871111 RepID=A0A2S2FFC6_9GAMM|nr:crotonase/enoyl-CoA hydratase family protein [Acinetobacter defluvii]AWL29673.1 crotonase/enoyl-CoA hydratase family protein [Acinetobacter defluvii]